MPSPTISFNNEDISFLLENKKIIKDWILKVIKSEKKSCDSINFIFCSDDYLLKINEEFLNHSTLTDIITFPYSEDEKKISGDIFISIERVADNATKFKETLSNELYRVMAHGILHLLGYKDKTKQDKILMTSKEDFYVNLLKN